MNESMRKTMLPADDKTEAGKILVAAMDSGRLMSIGGGGDEPMWVMTYEGDDPEVIASLRADAQRHGYKRETT